jgi:hypothetical protein
MCAKLFQHNTAGNTAPSVTANAIERHVHPAMLASKNEIIVGRSLTDSTEGSSARLQRSAATLTQTKRTQWLQLSE